MVNTRSGETAIAIQPLLTCILCGVQYQAPVNVTSYTGLCPDHWSKDTLREWDRIEAAKRHVLAGAPATLNLAEWLAIIGQFRGLCALCSQVQFSQLAIWTPMYGLVAGNVAPLCRSCHYHKEHSWTEAIEHVQSLLAQ